MKITINNQETNLDKVSYFVMHFGRPGELRFEAKIPRQAFLQRIDPIYKDTIEDLRRDDQITGEFEPPYPGATDYPTLEDFMTHPEPFSAFMTTYLRFDILGTWLREGCTTDPVEFLVCSIDRIYPDANNIIAHGTATQT